MKKALIGLLGAGLVVGLIAVLLVIAAAPSIVRQFKKSMLPKDMPELHPCVVNLQFGGTSTSLAGAIVTLHPEDETFEEWGTFSGTTDAKGKVVIKTEHNRKKYPGVFAGKYKVTVVKAVLPGISTDNPMNSHVEKRYAVKATTPLEINVPETGTHELFVHKANFSNPDDLPENIRTQVEEIERETHRPCSLTFHYREKPVPGLFLKLEPLQGGSQRDEEPLDRFSRVQREYIAFTNDEGVGKFVTIAVEIGSRYLLKEGIPEGRYAFSFGFPHYYGDQHNYGSSIHFTHLGGVDVTEEGHAGVHNLPEPLMRDLRERAGMTETDDF